MTPPNETQLLDLFAERETGALFLTEIAGALGVPVAAVEPPVAAMRDRGAVVVVDHTFPDPHLHGVDLRIAALAPAGVTREAAAAEALRNGEALWQTWLREFLGSHRCQ
jgi:hypothetical protein